MKEIFLPVAIPKEELVKHKYEDYIGFLFKNESGVYNVCTDVEDIMKSNQWFKNLPVNSYILQERALLAPTVGDIFWASNIANSQLNEKLFRYDGINEDGIDIFNFTHVTVKKSTTDISPELVFGEKFISTLQLLQSGLNDAG